MKKCIGIDFGMQNLKACYFDGMKKQKVDLEGIQSSAEKLAPNVIYYYENEDGVLSKSFFSSQKANDARKVADPDYIAYIKRTLQVESWKKNICGGKYFVTTEDVITDIFKQIFFKMNEYRCDMSSPTILTVPVVFSEIQKARLRKCAEKAGFHVQEIITEPFSAIFSDEISDECLDCDDEEKFVVVIDFGASTLDICLVGISEDSIRSLASTGINFGGKDMSDIISNNYLKPKLANTIKEALDCGRFDDDSINFELFELAERLKIELYDELDTPETGKERFFGEDVILKRVNVEKLLEESGIWKKIKTLLDEMLDSIDEGIDAEDVSQLIMIGGTSKIDWFSEKFEDYFSDAELIGDSEENDFIYHSVAFGAVNYLNQSLDVQNSMPMAIGVDFGRGFEIVLNRNTFYSTKGKTKEVPLDFLNRNSWKVKIYQTLKNKHRCKVTDDGILYAGYFQLKKDLYAKDTIYIRLSQNQKGLFMETMQMKDSAYETIESNISLCTEV